MTTAYLAVDLGSSSVRVMLGMLGAGPDGHARLTVREAARLANVPVPRAEGLAWDVPALWDGVLAGLASGIAMARAAGARVRGIGVDSWGVDYARLTTDGDVRDFVRHHRDADAELAAETARGRDLARDYAVTGVLDQAINTSHQLRQDAAAGIGDPRDTILPIADLFVHLLTGRVGAEASLASTTALLDRASGDWSYGLAAGLPARFPPVVPTGACVGDTTDEVTRRIGADAPVPVWAVTAHDTAAAFAAVTDADEPGTGVVSSGSWAVVGVALRQPLLTERARRAGFTQELGADGATLLVKNLSGMWLLQQTLREWAAVDALSDGAPTGGATQPGSIDALRELLAEAGRSTYPGRFDPADPALQAPGGLVARLEAACAAGGFTPPASRADLVRAIVDSLAIAWADALDEVERLTDRPVERVRVLGGGARNDLLCALTAHRTRRPVVAGPVEASVRGVLLQLAVAAGDVPGPAAARALAVDDGEAPDRLFLPDDAAPSPSFEAPAEARP
jgi:rhamnulokinase